MSRDDSSFIAGCWHVGGGCLMGGLAAAMGWPGFFIGLGVTMMGWAVVRCIGARIGSIGWRGGL